MEPSQEVAAIIASLETEGRLTASNVVETARDETSPLHSHFEWDDSAAAEEHRKEQARRLIRSVKIRVETNQQIAIRAPAYVSPPQTDTYVAIGKVRHDPDMAWRTVVAEIARAEAALQRARAVSMVLGFGEELDAIKATVAAFRERVETAHAE
jgi:hypothetical protein